MKFILQPWQLMLTILTSWAYRQQEVIEYLRGQNVVFEEKFCKKRMFLTEEHRCPLAVKANSSAAHDSNRMGL